MANRRGVIQVHVDEASIHDYVARIRFFSTLLALKQRNTHRIEVSPGNGTAFGYDRAIRVCMSINLEFDLVFVWNSGQHLGNRGSLDPRRAAKSFKGPINAMSESLHVGSFAPGACDLKSEHVTWIESGRHAAQFLQV